MFLESDRASNCPLQDRRAGSHRALVWSGLASRRVASRRIRQELQDGIGVSVRVLVGEADSSPDEDLPAAVSVSLGVVAEGFVRWLVIVVHWLMVKLH